MKNRIENLGDYNTARIMLQKKNGDLSALVNEFKHIGACIYRTSSSTCTEF